MLDHEDGSVLILRPRRPFIEWACGLGEDVTELAVLQTPPSAYIVPDADDLAQLLRKPKDWMHRVIETELAGDRRRSEPVGGVLQERAGQAGFARGGIKPPASTAQVGQ